MATIQELNTQISLIEQDKELLYSILTNKNIEGISVSGSLGSYIEKVNKLTNFAMYDYINEATMKLDTAKPVGTYGLVIKEMEVASQYYNGEDSTLYSTFAVSSRIQSTYFNAIADNQELDVKIVTDYGDIIGFLKVTNEDARIDIRDGAYTVKVYWDKIQSNAGEYILSKYEINGNDDYKAGMNYILPNAVYLQFVGELDNNNLKQALLQFMPQTNRKYESLNIYTTTGNWEVIFKQIEYEDNTQIKVYNTVQEMNADTVDDYTIGIVLGTDEVLRTDSDVSNGYRIYKALDLYSIVEIGVNTGSSSIMQYRYLDTNDEVLVRASIGVDAESTTLTVLVSKDYVDEISERTYTLDITYIYDLDTTTQGEGVTFYTFKIAKKTIYDSKLGITETVNIDSSTFDKVVIDTPKTQTSSVQIQANGYKISDGIYGELLYIDKNLSTDGNYWQFSGIYTYTNNQWNPISIGANATANTVFVGYTAYTDNGIVIGTGTADANAIASDILSGKTAYVNGVKITGTYDVINLDNELATQDSLLSTQSNTVSQVYTSFEDKMSSDLRDVTSDATATASDIVINKTAYVNGEKITGILDTDNLESELDALDSVIATQEAKILQLENDLANKMTADLTTLTSDATATQFDILEGKTAYIDGNKVTGILEPIDTEIANQTALITQLEELVQSKSVIQPVFENGNMSSLNSQVKKFIEPVIEAFTDYLDELQEQNVPYLDESITIYTPDINTLYFIIVKNSDGTYRILWSKSKYAGFYYVNLTDKRVNFLKTVGVRAVTDEINIHNADWNWSIYGSGADTNWLNKNDAYSSSRFSTLTALINAISNPNAEITYSHPQNSPSYGIDYRDTNYITNMIIWENNNGVQSKILDTIVTTQKLSNNVTILPLNN